MLNNDESNLLDLLEKCRAPRITFDVIKKPAPTGKETISESARYRDFIHNLDYISPTEYSQVIDDDSDNFLDGNKLHQEEFEVPNVVPVKEILDLFEEEYLFKLKDHGIMDRLRKRMENIQESSEYKYSFTT